MHRVLIITIFIVICCSRGTKAQDSVYISPDLNKIRRGPPIAVGVVLLEAVAGGYSYVASKPQWYGDKIMGGVYAASSIVLLAVGVNEYIYNKGDRKQQICGSILYLGLSYGLSRLAVYNLLQADGQSFTSRFNRNFIEFNAAYLVPGALYCLSEICFLGFPGRSVGKTSIYYTGNGLTLIRKL